MLISRTIAVGAIVALMSLGAAGAAFAAGEEEAGASGVMMSAPGVLPIVDETVTLHVAAIPHATVEDLTTNYATEWLEQQTGVHVEWNVLPRKDARQKINLMLTQRHRPAGRVPRQRRRHPGNRQRCMVARGCSCR